MHQTVEKLNPVQQEAVTTTDGPILIIAGAGSGKTMVLTHKIAYLIREKRAKPEEILAVTFTNKAAAEMRERVGRILSARGDGAPAGHGITIGTFHSVCLALIRRHAAAIGYSENIVIFDEKDQETLMKTVLEELRVNQEQLPPELFLRFIGKLKSRLVSPDKVETEDGAFQETAAHAYARYQEQLRAQNAVDFDDMVMLAVILLEQNPDILAQYQNTFRYILVDEYQDTNHAQYRFVSLLARAHRNLCVVGDNDQAIYGWRQADITNILNFERDYPDARVFVLEENYRSTQNILDAANHVIRKNKMRKEKNLYTAKGPGARVGVVMLDNEREEALFVARTIAERGKTPLSSCAVLYRTNAQSRAVEEVFVRLGIPYHMTGGFKFYERKEVKDMLAYLRLVHNPKDAISRERILNVPPRGIGAAAREHFLATGERTPRIDAFFALMDDLRAKEPTLPLSKFVAYIARATGIKEHLEKSGAEGQERWENIRELVSAAAAYDARGAPTALGEFLGAAALTSAEDKRSGADAVRMMTIHTAKGLEFETVFLIGMEDNVFPHSRSKTSPEEMEEERRLCYVAITRAKKMIYLVSARTRKVFGQTQANPPSRFLFDIPEHLIELLDRRDDLYDIDYESGIVDIGRA